MPASQPTSIEAEDVRQAARTYQYDRYLAALLAPWRHRDALIVLTGFAAELQRIPFLVSEPMMAAVRFQWWRDELIAATAPKAAARRSGHPLCDALVARAQDYGLPVGLLQGMIDAAESELDPTPFNEAAEVRQLLIKFEGALFELAGRVLGSAAPREVWQLAAVAYGGARLAGEYPRRRDVGAQTYTSRDCPEIAQALIAPAGEALEAVRGRRDDLDRAARGALLPLATVAPLLRGVTAQNQHTDATNALLSNFTRARLILWAHWRGRV